ncbi:hypothetical protein IMF23_04380 [Chelatococcus daeguensis]|uniref:hypothetical protein n=1 Tax=Chelatococcus daeguensis TaxID=444444 RepID=UPI0007AB28B8|nr:hypothetical protein [Chelatococcus daeguensis]KZE34115.1 hypothetical protein AVW15_17525 [Chelatococcus daeguensis]MBM3082673.1 hypothetical protein [Chelatococcus daeguensis]
MTEQLSLTTGAVLMWLPEGQEPTEAEFAKRGDHSMSPPNPNPEPWWELRQAIFYAKELDPLPAKRPWIKTGDEVLSPGDIDALYRQLRP